jgi:hypothetical protein
VDPHLKALRDTVDAFFAAAVAGQPGSLACGPCCTACCAVDLSVFPVEAAVVRDAFAALPEPVRAAAAARARAGRHCCLLDDGGRCVVYADRPLICRTQGLALLIDGRLDPCPLNYRDEPPRRAHVLVLERLNEALAAVDIRTGGRGERVRLAEVAGG